MKFFCLWLLLLTISLYTYAQDLRFRHLTIKDGLSHNTVNCFLQDSKGFMWVGTQDGLNRYDGYEFEIYRHETQKKHTLENNYINALHEDKNQNIWIGTYGGGLYKYDNQYNRFIKINEIIGGSVFAILENTEKNLWVAAEKLLFKLDSKSNKFITYPQFTDAVISSFLEIDRDRFLVGTNGAGFYILNIKTGQTEHYQHQENDNSVCNNNITSLYKDMNGHIWIGTVKGLDKFDAQKLTYEHFKPNTDSQKSLLGESIKRVVGRGNEVWIATENNGLSK